MPDNKWAHSAFLFNLGVLMRCVSDLLEELDADAICKAQVLIAIATELVDLKSKAACAASTMDSAESLRSE